MTTSAFNQQSTFVATAQDQFDINPSFDDFNNIHKNNQRQSFSTNLLFCCVYYNEALRPQYRKESRTHVLDIHVLPHHSHSYLFFPGKSQSNTIVAHFTLNRPRKTH